MCYLGSGRTGLTKFISPFQNSRQNLSLPNFQFVKRGRTDTRRIFVNHKFQSHGNKHYRLLAIRKFVIIIIILIVIIITWDLRSHL